MRLRRFFALALAPLFVAAIAAGGGSCGKENKENSGYGEYDVDAGYLYGMDYIAFEGVGNGTDYKKGFQLMHNLGVKSIRNWMHVTWFFNNDLTRNEENIATMHDIIAEAEKHEIQLIGMSHKNINNGTDDNAKPARDLSEGSYYLQWLDTYEESWYLLAKEFTEITYWEIDNECNNSGFMPRIGGGTFSQTQMSQIFTDMLYNASLGIHRGNPKAVTVMGGLTEPSGLGSGQTKTFMQKIYDNIAGGKYGGGNTNPDDYFQVACWHPYSATFDADNFVKYNDEIYQVILNNEKKHKKVFLTEVGAWTQTLVSGDVAASYLTDLYATVRDRMPYVEAMHYFRAFDNVIDNNNNAGIFYDPNPERTDMNMETNTRANPGAPKKAAYAFQKIAGGTGDLTLLEIKL